MESIKSPKDYIFHTYTREGYVIKGIIDILLNNLTKDVTITFDEFGIHSSCADAHSVVLVAFDLLRKNLQNYICEYKFTGNFVLKELHKTIKGVRKKDSITMYVKKDQPTKLILVTSPQITHDVISTIVSSESVIFSLSEPIVHSTIDSYLHPYTMTSSNFQKVAKKMIATIKGDNVELYMQGTNYVRFYCTNNINESTSEFGIKEEMADTMTYKGKFFTTMFGNLLKLQTMSKELKIYAPLKNNKHPLRIEVNTGNLGVLNVYLKSCECIEAEKGTHTLGKYNNTPKGRKKI